MRWTVLVLLAGCAAVPQRTIVIPTVAYPFNSDTLARADVQACAATIASLSAGEIERAAFLQLNDGGTFDCRMWRGPFTAHRAEWAGAAPKGTVAVMHSHPRDTPDPSSHDRAEAVRIGIPVLVVTPAQITMALPRDGAVVRMNRSGFSVAYTASDETRRNHHPHTGQARSLPHERSRAHPQAAPR